MGLAATSLNLATVDLLYRWKDAHRAYEPSEEECDDDEKPEKPKVKGPSKAKKAKSGPAKPSKKKASPKEKPTKKPYEGDALHEAGDDDHTYKPGKFREARIAFIRKARRQNPSLSYKEASTQWNLSNERAEYIASLPLEEQARRRFI